MNAANPLLDFAGLTRFDLVRPAHVAPAVDALIAEARDTVERVATAAGEATWESVALPIASALDRLDRAWSAVRHLNAVVSTPELRDAYNGSLPKVTALYTDIGQDERLYAKYKAIAASPAFASLHPAQRKVVENELRDFRLGGAELPPEQKKRFKEVQQELATLSAKFDDNVLDAQNAWALYVDEARLAGVPADVVATARADASAEGKAGCKLTLRMPCYLPVMQYADDRALRAEMHRGYTTLASDLGNDPAHDNTHVIERILLLREEQARLLGYANFAEVSLVPKMASSPAEVARGRRAGPRARP